MAKNLTPTVVVRRPVDEIEQVTLFSKRKPYVEFEAPRVKQILAGAKGIIARSGDGQVELYVEHPHITFRVIYSGLDTTYMKPTDHVKEGAVIGLARGVFRVAIQRLPDYTPAEPEFFTNDEVIVRVKDDDKPRPDPDDPFLH